MTRAWIAVELLAVLCTCSGCRARMAPPAPWYEPVVRASEVARVAAPGEDPADDVDHTVLPTREAALDVLLRTETFTDTAVWGEGVTPVQLKAFHVLLREPDARDVFRVMVRRAKPAGQMFALCGLYLVDRAEFRRAVRPFRSDRRSLMYQYGCGSSRTTVADLVEKAGPVIRFPAGRPAPDDFYSEFSGYPARLDIAGGGWPEVFRTAVARMDDKGDIRAPATAEGLEGDADQQESLFGDPAAGPSVE